MTGVAVLVLTSPAHAQDAQAAVPPPKSTRVLFMDDETLRDPTKNVRGGVPVLFPTPGKLVDDKWSYAGHSGSMKQHGFARSLPWELAATSDVDCASATLRLRATVLVPTVANGGNTLNDTWSGQSANEPFDDTAWIHGPLSVGCLLIGRISRACHASATRLPQ
jgi:hypothetical protein